MHHTKTIVPVMAFIAVFFLLAAWYTPSLAGRAGALLRDERLVDEPSSRPSEWERIFNGRDLSGWRANFGADSFRVVDGVLKVNSTGRCPHLFFVGDDPETIERLRNFELKVTVRGGPNSNSGIFFHTNITDATYLLNHLFSGGSAPVAPYPECGPSMLPADAALGCANPPDCQ